MKLGNSFETTDREAEIPGRAGGNRCQERPDSIPRRNRFTYFKDSLAQEVQSCEGRPARIAKDGRDASPLPYALGALTRDARYDPVVARSGTLTPDVGFSES